MDKRLLYVCLQATREGQASHAHVHEIVKGMRARGWDVLLCEPRWTPGRGRLTRTMRILGAIMRSYGSMRGRRYVYVRDHPMALPVVWFASSTGRLVILEINGRYNELFIQYPGTRRIAGLVRRQALRRLALADLVVAVTEGLARWASAHVRGAEVVVVPNGAAADLFVPGAPRPNGLPPRYAVFVGVLAVWQGVETLLAAASDPGWPEGVALVLAGEGVLASKVREAASALPGRVVGLGGVAYADVPGLVANAVCGLSPQNAVRGKDGYSPLKVFEGMSCGVPVVVSDFPGLSDVVMGADCGLVRPHDDPAAWAEAVAWLASHEDEAGAMGRRGRAAVEAVHSWDKRAEATGAAIAALGEG